MAAQPGAWSVLRRRLDNGVEAVPVHSIDDGFQVLDHDSRMVEFLQAVKRNPPTRAIPFLCSRVLANVLPDRLVGEMRNLCKQCGAVDLVDISTLDADAARAALRAAIDASLQ